MITRDGFRQRLRRLFAEREMFPAGSPEHASADVTLHMQKWAMAGFGITDEELAQLEQDGKRDAARVMRDRKIDAHIAAKGYRPGSRDERKTRWLLRGLWQLPEAKPEPKPLEV